MMAALDDRAMAAIRAAASRNAAPAPSPIAPPAAPIITVAAPVPVAKSVAAITFEQEILISWKGSADLRGSFGNDLGAYAAFRRADRDGRARVYGQRNVIRGRG
jgi:hypothetical protein